MLSQANVGNAMERVKVPSLVRRCSPEQGRQLSEGWMGFRSAHSPRKHLQWAYHMPGTLPGPAYPGIHREPQWDPANSDGVFGGQAGQTGFLLPSLLRPLEAAAWPSYPSREFCLLNTEKYNSCETLHAPWKSSYPQSIKALSRG